MDNFINLAKQGYSAYESSQGQGQQSQQGQGQQGQQYQQGQQGQQQGQYDDQQQGQGEQQYNIQGGAQWNAPHNQQSGAPPQIDQAAAVSTAQDAAQGSGSSSLFSSALGFVNNNTQEHSQPVDEAGVQQAHDQAYNQGNASSLDAGGIGGAAAMQMLKQFTSGGASASGGSGGQTQLVSMAMGEAAKLFDQSGGGSGGTKQDAVNSAAMTVMKLLVQSKFSGAIGGGNSGGLGSMMSMASQFL